ncbi:MAG: hypothetical protein RLZ56_1310 [Bacteroidota bacterium]|jgi:hypothetical protein
MKKTLILTYASICFFTIGCTKEQNNNIINQEVSRDFIEDTLVGELLNINSQLINTMKPSIDSIKPLLRKNMVSNREKLIISKALGFEDIEQYDLFVKTQHDLVEKIKTKYPTITKSSNIRVLLQTAIQKNKNSTIKTLRLDNRCGDRLNNCLALGNTVYTAEILGCTAGAIGIGSVTLGVGGIIFQIACGAAALEHLSIMRTGCQLDYNDCH